LQVTGFMISNYCQTTGQLSEGLYAFEPLCL
jgi:hypothetical protein